MHPVIKAQLKDFSTAHPNDTLTQFEFFEVFSIHSIENGLMGLNIDPFSAHLEAKKFLITTQAKRNLSSRSGIGGS